MLTLGAPDCRRLLVFAYSAQDMLHQRNRHSTVHREVVELRRCSGYNTSHRGIYSSCAIQTFTIRDSVNSVNVRCIPKTRCQIFCGSWCQTGVALSARFASRGFASVLAQQASWTESTASPASSAPLPGLSPDPPCKTSTPQQHRGSIPAARTLIVQFACSGD